MLIRKAYKFRLKANRDTERKLSQFAGCTRYVWNKVLALQNEHRKSEEKLLSKSAMIKLLPEWKKEPDTSFLGDVHSQILQQKIIDLDKAIQDSFRKGTDSARKQWPRFKKKGQHDSFRYPQGFKIHGNAVYLPKIGIVPFYQSRKIEGTPKQLTVSRQAGHWYISIQVEQEIGEPLHTSTSAVRIDMGITNLITLSTGERIAPVNALKRFERKLAIEQRKLARKKKYSSNWKKQKARISLLHHKIANIRKDALHKLSTDISKNHAVVCIEDLKVSNMSASAKGTVEQPGHNVKAKAGLNKSILDQGWFELRRQLEYKLLWRGGELVTVEPKYTSQTCSECGYVSPENRKTQAVFKCTACGYENNADINAAINILAVGHTVAACGETSLEAHGSRNRLTA
jgi:putative transposase